MTAHGPSEALARLAEVVRAGGSVLLALDFDGTLAPLVDDPADSRALPEALGAVERLGRVPGVRVAVVSGRAIEDLAALAHVPDGTILVGSHGAERGHLAEGALVREPLDLDDDAVARRERVAASLADLVAGTTARLEHKPASVVLHTRRVPDGDAARLTQAALGLGGPGIDAMRGKDVVELSVLEVTKGHALADLRRDLAVDVLLYAGDDVTDERAFATLSDDDVTVRVGPGETAARFRVADPEALAAELTRLAALLEQGAEHTGEASARG